MFIVASGRVLFKWLLGALLMLTGMLAPVESPDLPAPLDDLAGAPPASAQALTPTVFDGDPDPCPDPPDPPDPPDTRPWKEDGNDPSLCVLRDSACGEHPLDLGTYLSPSIEFPDFCEATVLESADPSMYQACTSLRGYVIQDTTTLTGQECRMIRPARCASQLHRVGFNTCLRVQRRTWSCPEDTVPRNQFNSCYRPPPAYTGTNPACGSGAPAFPIVTCDEYVGGDFVRNPTPGMCNKFPTGDRRSALQDHTANQHWCWYDASFLDVGCHATGAVCETSYAYCVKRSSRTGGCDVVADTLRCRGWQADYLDPNLNVSANDVYRQGCTPCVVLPFQSVPAECPDELLQQASFSTDSDTNLRHEWAHTYQEDFLEGAAACVFEAHGSGVPMNSACRKRARCTDPPRGRIVWESNHHSGFAIVNSLITLNIEDIPNQTREVWWLENTLVPGFVLVTESGLRYEYSDTSVGDDTGVGDDAGVGDDTGVGDPVIRTWYRVNNSQTHGSVTEIVRGECIVRSLPDFRVLIEELWPDNDEAAIEELFGAGTLNWWWALSSTERGDRTKARGLEYVDGMTPARLEAELERRATTLNEEIRCNFGSDVWCKWTPPRPGYYRLTAAGGWHMKTFGRRRWLTPAQISVVEEFLQKDVTPGDGRCRSKEDRFGRGRDYDCIMKHLDLMGVTPEEIGLEHDPVNRVFTGLISRPPGRDNEWLYSDAAGENVRCRPRDLRVNCGGGTTGVNYTESEPAGIIVHEMRVSTVTPSR